MMSKGVFQHLVQGAEALNFTASAWDTHWDTCCVLTIPPPRYAPPLPFLQEALREIIHKLLRALSQNLQLTSCQAVTK
jgi:hypothetical protein